MYILKFDIKVFVFALFPEWVSEKEKRFIKKSGQMYKNINSSTKFFLKYLM